MAIASPLNLTSITKGVQGLGIAVNRARVSANRSAGILLNRTKIKSKLVFGDRLAFNKTRESVRRKRQESLLEVSTLGNFIKSGAVTLGNTTRGFLGRIMDFIGTLLLGWMLNNLPTIISMAQELMGRIQRLVNILGGFVTNIGRSLFSFGNVLGAVAQNIASFDFFDTSNRVEYAMKDLNSVFDDMSKQIDEGMQLFTTPLTEGLVTGESAAPFGTDYTTQPGLPDESSPEMYRIAAALSTEGSGSQSTVDMMQLVANRKATGKYGQTYTDILASPGQFEGVFKRNTAKFRKIQTLDDAAKWSGQSKQTLLKIIKDIQNPTLQANAANFVGGALEFRASPQNNRNGRLPGTAWRGGSGDNQFLVDQSRGDPIKPGGAAQFNLPAPVVAAPSPINGVTTTVKDEINVAGSRGGTPLVGLTPGQGFGASRGARSHQGIDIGTSGQRGYFVALRKTGKVDFVGSRGGYGIMVDIIGPDGTCYRFAHLARTFVRRGETYNGQTIGEIGNTGAGTGIHLHFEVRPGGPFAAAIDPKPYLGLLSIGKQLTGIAGQPVTLSMPTPAIITAQSQRRQQLPGQLTPERMGQQIVVIDDVQPQQPTMQQAPSGGSQMMPFPTANPLNSFIKTKLLLDLAYT